MQIDRSKIKTSSLNDFKSITQLDAAYEEAALDAGVCAQVEENFRKRSNVKDKLAKSLEIIQRDIRLNEDEIKRLECKLDELLCSVTKDSNRNVERSIRSVENEIEAKMKLLDTLRERKASCEEYLQAPDDPIIVEHGILPASDRLPQQPDSKANKVTKPTKRPSKTPNNRDDADVGKYHRRMREVEDESSQDSLPDEVLEGGLRVPGGVWERLYPYQREAVSWLWGLHQHGVGGILGDEMGLGKTIQVIAFFAALHHSKLPLSGSSYDLAISRMSDSASPLPVSEGLGPVLIVCPGTVLQQWLSEFRAWMPAARVVIIHSSNSGVSNIGRALSSLFRSSGVAVTTYGTLMQHREAFVRLPWHYVVLDEGHKIKNPQAEVTRTVKLLATPHRLLMSGTPMQNNLKELWCLFDFVYPGKLGGGLVDFLVNFAVPITQGGYANATPLQVETAYRCACTLKRILSPYLLRRLKADVRLQLPNKSEQVLFCHLTHYQRVLYEEYLGSRVCQSILRGCGPVLGGLVVLKKLCNHPDLVTGGPRHFGVREGEEDDTDADTGDEWMRFGCSRRSGKLLVTLDLLALWWKQRHKVLLFSQSRKMLDVLERHAQRRGYTYVRMDGGTAVGRRASLVDEFNAASSEDCFLFLLTTRVGGLGVNLVGADRVLLFDPDWNPATDAQARERAWRIGQTRDVLVFRLLASGTIEEKIYQRQIYKHFLTNRVLRNPRQQRFFKLNSLYDLFSLDGPTAPSDTNGGQATTTTTDSFFKAVGVPELAVTNNRFDRLFANAKKLEDVVDSDDEGNPLADERLEPSTGVEEAEEESADQREARLRAKARRLSRQLVESYQRQKKGARVDGQRIRGVERRARFDEGTEEHPRQETQGGLDPFVATLICGPNAEEERTSSLKRKREEVDEEMVTEAKRVAEAALSALRREEKKRRRREEKRERRRRRGDALAPVKKRLEALTCVDHDKMMSNYLMSESKVDPALERLQASRLAESVVGWLKEQAAKRDPSFDAAPIPIASSKRPPPNLRFGRVKNDFLWSPNEGTSPLYLSHKLQTNDQRALEPANNLLFSGHNRLSSSLMLEVIRQRRRRSMAVLGISSRESDDSPSADERALRAVALQLLSLFMENDAAAVTPSAMTSEIAERFQGVLTRKRREKEGELTGRHVRTLLRCLANPPRVRSDDGGGVWVLKMGFVAIARQLTYLRSD